MNIFTFQSISHNLAVKKTDLILDEHRATMNEESMHDACSIFLLGVGFGCGEIIGLRQ